MTVWTASCTAMSGRLDIANAISDFPFGESPSEKTRTISGRFSGVTRSVFPSAGRAFFEFRSKSTKSYPDLSNASTAAAAEVQYLPDFVENWGANVRFQSIAQSPPRPSASLNTASSWVADSKMAVHTSPLFFARRFLGMTDTFPGNAVSSHSSVSRFLGFIVSGRSAYMKIFDLPPAVFIIS